MFRVDSSNISGQNRSMGEDEGYGKAVFEIERI
jgi:hypothetical protein